MPGGKYMQAFPIIVQVDTEEDADEVLTYAPAVKVLMSTLPEAEQVRLAWTLPGGDTILRGSMTSSSSGPGIYPVAYGNKCAIFLS